jgi:N-acetylmuramoyl-L-alanine amidase
MSPPFFIRLLLLSFCFAAAQAVAGAKVTSARIWPAPDYTRVTLEAKEALKFNSFTLKNPDRLVVDIEADLDEALSSLSGKVVMDDPYINLVRVARFKANTVRLVLDLKGEVKPNVFLLPPVAEYGFRLVIDINPIASPDPLMLVLGKDGLASEPVPPKEVDTQAKDWVPPVALPDAPMKNDHGEKADTGKKLPPNKAKPLVDRLVTIVIDAGHGGEDPGARGANGSQEKDVTLAIAQLLKDKIDREGNMRAVLTREGDYYIALGQRVEKARRVQADLFVSIHADAFIRPNARGSSVFALSERGATSTQARWLAKQENAADLIGGVNLKQKDPYLARTLLDLSQTATINDSLRLGRAVLGEIGGINRLHRGEVEQAGFAVLKAPDIPSILVETAFISNPEEESRLNDPAYQSKLADSIVSGIKRYLAKNPALAKSKLATIE